MKKEIAEKWVAALRSGEYKQLVGQLASAQRTEHCCLGVLCELAIKDDVDLVVEDVDGATLYGGAQTSLPSRVLNWAGMSSKVGEFNDGSEHLAAANDVGVPFATIADTIERRWEEL